MRHTPVYGVLSRFSLSFQLTPELTVLASSPVFRMGTHGATVLPVINNHDIPNTASSTLKRIENINQVSENMAA